MKSVKKFKRYIPMAIGLLLLLGAYFGFSGSGSHMTKEAAVKIVQAAHTEFRSYPSNLLPPKSIRTKEGEGGWYVGFVREGSGRPYLGADCFFVTDSEIVVKVGTLAGVHNDSLLNLSLNNCTVH